MPQIKRLSEIIIDAFKAGNYPQGKFSEKELQEIAETYDPAKLHEAPILIGHDSDYTDSRIPAFGWIGRVIKAGDHLKFVVSQFSEDLKSLIEKGMYKKVSAAFYAPGEPSNPTPGKWHLHHLAFLGAQPPQVKGLEGIAFSEKSMAQVVIVDFDEEAVLDEAEQLANVDTYEELQECFAMTLANVQKLITDGDGSANRSAVYGEIEKCFYECQTIVGIHFGFLDKKESIIDGLKEKVAEMKERFRAKFKNNTHKESTDMADKQELETKLAEMSEKVKSLEAEKTEAALKAKADAELAQNEQIKADVTAFMETLKTKGYPVKKMEEMGVPALLQRLAKAGEIEFGEGKKESALQIVKALIETGSPVPTGEVEGMNDSIKQFAEKKRLNGNVDEKSLRVIMFAERYVSEHPAEFKGLTDKQANALAVTRILNGQIEVTK